MAPTDLTLLSSNWKALQEKLKQEKLKPDKAASEPSLKRRRADVQSGESKAGKRQKVLPTTPKQPNGHMEKLKRKFRPRSKSTPTKASSNERAERTERPSTSHSNHNPTQSEAQINEGVSPSAIAGKYVALDCEMVGFGPTPDNDSQLARVSLVDYNGHQLYDSFVKPQFPVTDYRTHITGITSHTLKTSRPIKEVQQDVATLMSGRIVVAHAIKNDLDVLMLSHPKRDIRDTSRHPGFRALSMGKAPSLKKLAKELLDLDIQGGAHSSVEDARTCMLLFRKYKEAFESEHAKKWGRPKNLEAVEGDLVDGRTTKKKRKKKGKK